MPVASDVDSLIFVLELRRGLDSTSTGHNTRATGATNVHAHSSRSHLVLTVYIEMQNTSGSGGKSLSKLNLVDLAGSERLAKSGATGDRLTESTHINKSLSALGSCIAALVNRSKRLQAHAAHGARCARPLGAGKRDGSRAILIEGQAGVRLRKRGVRREESGYGFRWERQPDGR